MAVTTEQVAELYVAYFNRAPDTAGLAYWVETGLAIEDISSSFYVQDETKTNYPDTMTDAIFVNTIYQNVFNRDADANGLVYWEDELANETVTRPNMILAIVNGAQDTDLGQDDTILANKTEVGLYSADLGIDDVEKTTDIMKDVDETAESVSTAKIVADNYAVLALTLDPDTIVGTVNDDVITGTVLATGSTYTVGDTIDGGEGEDTVKLQVGGAGTDPSATFTNIESVDLFGSAAFSFNAYNWGTVENYIFGENGGNGFTISNINNPISSVTIDKSISGGDEEILDFFNKDVQDTDNDILDITLSNSTSNADVMISTQVEGTASDIYEELTIHSIDNTGDTTELKINDSKDIAKVTVDGNSNIIVTIQGENTDATDIELFDASALTGNLSYTSASTSIETIKGGSGDDTIDAGPTGANIWGGEGLDTINCGSGMVSLKYDYLDKESGLTTATADSVTNLTSGTDSISFRGLDAGSDDNFYSDSTTVVASIEEAVTAANSGLLATKTYVQFTNGGNYLVIDANGNGEADGAIELISNSIAATDIVVY
jgi:hypothetical protein